MTKKQLLKPYKPGNLNYEILRLLWDAKKVVSYKDLMVLKNPLISVLLDNPKIYKLEREKLKANIKKLNRQIELRGFLIKANRKKEGYVLKELI